MALIMGMLSPRRTNITNLCKLAIIVLVLLGSTECKRQRWGSRREHLSHPCAKCDKRDCKEVTPETCDGLIQKDDCNCCPKCIPAKEDKWGEEEESKEKEDSPLVQPTEQQMSNACKNITCPRNKVCILNIQGIPMCRCPTVFWCKKSKKKQPLCGEDGKTYKSRCYLRIQECNKGIKIKVAARTTCAKKAKKDEAMSDMALQDEKGKKKKNRPWRLSLNKQKGSRNRGQGTLERKRKGNDKKEKRKNRRQINKDRGNRKSRRKRRHQ